MLIIVIPVTTTRAANPSLTAAPSEPTAAYFGVCIQLAHNQQAGYGNYRSQLHLFNKYNYLQHRAPKKELGPSAPASAQSHLRCSSLSSTQSLK